MSILSYKNAASRDIAENLNTKSARKLLPLTLHKAARKIIATLNGMTNLNDLKIFTGWKLESLKGDRKGQFSLRINKQFRVCFIWNGHNVSNVEIVDYH